MNEQDETLKPTESLDSWLERTAPRPTQLSTVPPWDKTIQSGESVADWLIRTDPAQTRPQGLDFSIDEGSKIPPERAARVLRAQIKSKLPDWMVNQNLDQVESLVKEQGFDRDKFASSSPIVAKWMAESAHKSAALLDDVANAGKLEILMRRPQGLWPMSPMETVRAARDIATWQINLEGKEIEARVQKYSKMVEDSIRATGGRDHYAQLQMETAQQDLKDFQAGKAAKLENLYGQHLSSIQSEEAFLLNDQPVGGLEAVSQTAGENPLFWAPFASSLPKIAKGLNLIQAAKDYTTAQDPGAKALLERVARVQAAAELRSKSFSGMTADVASALPSFAGEMVMTGGMGGVGKKAVMAGGEEAGATLLRRALGTILEGMIRTPAVGITEIPARAIERARPKYEVGPDGEVQQTAPGASPLVASGQATLDMFTDVLAAEMFGLWTSQPGEAAAQAVKKSVILEALKSAGQGVGMGEAAKAMKSAVGLQPWDVPGPIKMLYDTEALKEQGAQALVFGLMGAGHAGLERVFPAAPKLQTVAAEMAREAQLYAEGLSRAHELQADMGIFKAAPEAGHALMQTLVEDSPHEFTYAPLEVVRAYARERRFNPRDLARVLGAEKQYDELTLPVSDSGYTVAGGAEDLQIPRAAYEAFIRQEPQAAEFFDKQLRSAPGAMNAAQAERYHANLAEGQKFLENLKQEGEKPLEDPALEAIVQSTYQKLLDAGQTPEVAEPQSRIMRGVAVLAKRAGRDPLQYWADKNLALSREVGGPAPTEGRVFSQPSERLSAAWEGRPRGEFFQPGEADLSRGKLTMGSHSVEIGLLKNADLSTFLHETGHFYLEVMKELAPSSPDLAGDWKTISEWLGHKEGKEITDAQHEQFARGFEQYLMDGKAPSESLKTAFGKFRSWLLSIYSRIKGYFKPEEGPTPEVKGVFDRMLATRDEIDLAQKAQRLYPVLADPAALGMSESDAEKIIHATDEARHAAEEWLNAKLMAEARREQSREYKEERAALRVEVAREVGALPEQLALAAIQKRELPDGTPLSEDHPAAKLDPTASAKLFGERYEGIDRKFFPRGIFAESGGMHPDTAAELFGYGSGKELLQALQKAEPRETLIERQTDALMKAKYPHLLESPTLPAEALRAAMNDKEQLLLRKQLEWIAENRLPAMKALFRAVSRGPARIDVIREEAGRSIGERRIRALNPEIYRRAAASEAVAAREALLKGDWQGTFDAMVRQLRAQEFYCAAYDARQDVAQAVTYLRQFKSGDVRAKIGKADYLAQVDRLLDRFDLRRASEGELKSRDLLAKGLAEWSAEREAEGFEPVALPERLKDDAFRVTYKDLSVDELLGVRDAVKQIEHQAGLVNALQAGALREARAEFKARLIAEAEKGKGLPTDKSRGARSLWDRTKSLFRSADAGLVKPEAFLRELSGHDIQGAWMRIFLGASEAQTAEYDLAADVSGKLETHLENMPKEIRSRLGEKVKVGKWTLTRRDVLGLLLNAGNESNWSKLVRGEGMRPNGLTEAEIREAIAGTTKAERDFVQGIWDTLESLWPRISQLHKELSGLEPKKVEARPQVAELAGYRGGYYPLIYDALESITGQKQAEARATEGLMQPGYQRATLASGYRQARSEGYAAPVDYDVDNLPGHIGSVIKDLTHRKWLIDANWATNDPEIMAALRTHAGPEYAGMLRDWVKRVVNDRNTPSAASLSVFRRLVSMTRGNMAIVACGYKVSTFLHHALSIGAAIDEVGPKDFAAAAGECLRAPSSRYREMIEKSGEMRHYLETMDRDFRDLLRNMEGKPAPVAKLQEGAIRAIAFANTFRSLPTWWGGYRKAIRELTARGVEGAELEKLAVHSADQAVRLTAGASGAKDLAAVMAPGSEFMKLWTMFYTPGSALYSKLRELGIRASSNPGKALVGAFFVWPFAAMLSRITAGDTPDKKKRETWGGWALKANVSYPLSSVPLARDLGDKLIYGRDAEAVSPGARAADVIVKGYEAAVGLKEGTEPPRQAASDLYRAANYWLGIPSDQVQQTGEYLWDLEHGNVGRPDDFWTFYHNLLHYHPKRRHSR